MMREAFAQPMRFDLTLAAGILSTGLVAAAERDAIYPRLIGQLLVGTSGVEPGVAAEFSSTEPEHPWRLRPEIFISEDGRVGAGLSLSWRVVKDWITGNDELYVGPQAVFHISDDHGWEGSAQAIYSFPIVHSMPDHHFLQVIGAVGVVDDRKHADHHADFAGTIGVAYAYQF